MAIKVATTTVINNSRALENIAGASGAYDNFHPTVQGITSVIDFNEPVMTRTMSASQGFTEANKGAGRSSVLLLDTSASGHTPSFASGNIDWPAATEPTWGDHRYWNIFLVCWDSTTVRASAVGYD